VAAAGSDGPAGKKLKDISGWSGDNGNGTNDYRFSALPGGGRGLDASFIWAGSRGAWWTTAEGDGGSYAHGRHILSGDDGVYEGNYVTGAGLSVRCIAD